MITTRVKIRKDRRIEGKSPIEIHVYHNRKRKRINTGELISPEYWDDSREMPKPKYVHHHYLRNRLIKLLDLLEEFRQEHIIDKKVFDFEEFTQKFKLKLSGKLDVQTFFFKYYEEKLEEYRDKGKHKTAKTYKSALRRLKSFRKNDLPIRDVNYKYINDFDTFLRKKGNSINTVGIHMRSIKAIYNKAIKENLVDEKLYPFKNYSIKREQTHKKYLSRNELVKLKNLDLSNKPDLEFHRDIFMFGVFARGINYVDIVKLKSDNVIKTTSKDNREIYRLLYSRSKTNGKFSVEMDAYMIRIYLKYRTTDTSVYKYLFPIIKNENELKYYDNRLKSFNKKLKLIAGLAGVQSFSSYWMRYSFAMLAKEGGITTDTIKEFLGHSNVAITETYLSRFSNNHLDDETKKILNF